eukprot:1980908-Pyramimonas_sp.AAC.1
MLSAQLQSSQIAFNSTPVGTVHQAVCEAPLKIGGKCKPGGPPKGELEREAPKVVGQDGNEKRRRRAAERRRDGELGARLTHISGSERMLRMAQEGQL